VTVIAASTTWGLFLLVLMLGYGLVQVPLNVYNNSRTFYMLSHVQFKLSQLYNEKIDIEERLESLVDETSKLSLQIKYNDPLRPCLEEIVKIIPEQYSNRVKLTMDDYEDYRRTTTNNLIDLPSEKQLIKLHGLLKKSKHIHHRVQASWVQMINQAFYLEDILNNEKNTNHLFVKQSPLPKSWLRQKLFDEHPKLG
jgi:regulator of replication initiation timing